MRFLKVEPQPAYLLYPVERGWRIAKYVWTSLFSRTGKAAEWWYKHGRDLRDKAKSSGAAGKYFAYCAAGGLYLAGASQYLCAMLFASLFIAVQVIILSGWFVGVALLISLLALYTKAYSLYYRAYYRCPACHEAMDVPVFLCACGTEHTRLWPSLYGVLQHVCTSCGRRLATTEWNGRESIERRCANPSCRHPLSADVGTLTNFHVPVVGGPSTGKSNLIVSAVQDLLQRASATGVVEVEFPDAAHQREFEANVSKLSSGRELAKTTDLVPQAYNVSIRGRKERVGKIAYVYDAAGEAYADEEQSRRQRYFEYVHGVILVVDPFSISDLRDELGNQVDALRTTLRPSPLGIMESYERMLTVLEAKVGVAGQKAHPHPLSVVVTKVDAFDLETRIGAPAARKRRAADPSIASDADAIDLIVRDFLVRYGLENFVRDVERQFASVRYFSCSALGRMPGPSPERFVPVRAIDPLLSVLVRAQVVEPAAAEALGRIDTLPA